MTLVAAVGRTRCHALVAKGGTTKTYGDNPSKKLAYPLVISYIAIEHECL